MKASHQLGSVTLAAIFVLLLPLHLHAQDPPAAKYQVPSDLQASDPEIRRLLDTTRDSCGKTSIDDVMARSREAIRLADGRGLVKDRALAEAALAAGYFARAELDLAYAEYQKALQDALDSQNVVLQADVLISSAAQGQLKGNPSQTAALLSRAVSLSDSSGTLYEKARALGELGRVKLLLGRPDEAIKLIDEALQIDTLNSYPFRAIHLVYRGYYLAATNKVDDAIDCFHEAIRASLVAENAFGFLMAENAAAAALVQQGKAAEAISNLSYVSSGDFQHFVDDPKVQACLASVSNLPFYRAVILEGLAGAYGIANQKDRALEVWTKLLSYSHENHIPAAEAEAAKNAADLSSQLKNTDDALSYYAQAIDVLRSLQNESLLNQAEFAASLLLVQSNRHKEALPLVGNVAAYAHRNNLRALEAAAHFEEAEILQVSGDVRERAALEQALALVQPGPFDSEIDNHLVFNAYTRLADIFRADAKPIDELVSIENALLTAFHLHDEAEQQRVASYLDQRMAELEARQEAARLQTAGRLAEALLYSCVILAREGIPSKPDADASNWNRVLTLPFQIVQTPGGASALATILERVAPIVEFWRLPLLEALSRHYIGNGSNPSLAEKYALQAEELLKTSNGNFTTFRSGNACVLATAHALQFKAAAAKKEIADCLHLAEASQDKAAITFARATNVVVLLRLGEIGAARAPLEELLPILPDNPEIHVDLARALASSGQYARASSELQLVTAKLSAKGDKKAVANAYAMVAGALNSDQSSQGQHFQLQYLTSAYHLYRESNSLPDEASALLSLGQYHLKLGQTHTALQELTQAANLAQLAARDDILAQALLNEGNGLQTARDFAKAREAHRSAADLYGTLKAVPLQTLSLIGLANDYAALHDTDGALTVLLEAKSAAEHSTALYKYLVRDALGTVYGLQGQFDSALATYREAQHIADEAADSEHSASAQLAVARVDEMIGAWDDAVGALQNAVKLYQQNHNKSGEAEAWARLVGIYSDRSSSVKNFDLARECYEKAQSLGYGNTAQLLLTETYLQTGKYDEMARAARTGLTNCRKSGNTDCQASLLLVLSEAQRRSGDTKAARLALDAARPMVAKSLDLYLRGSLLYYEANQLTAENKLDAAVTAYKRLIELLEGLKATSNSNSQGALSENYEYIYEEIVSLLYSMSQREQDQLPALASDALRYAEIDRARQFAQSWGRAFISQLQNELPAELQERERLLSKKGQPFQSRKDLLSIAADVKKTPLAARPTELTTPEREKDALVQAIREAAPQYASVAYPSEVQISALPLRDGEMLAEFKMTDAATFVWLIQRQAERGNKLVSFYRIPHEREWFRRRLTLLRQQMNSGNPQLVDLKDCEFLYHTLFPGDAGTIVSGARELIIIPDDVLYLLPFEIYSPTASASEFVFIRKAITYYPSAVSFELARAGGHPGAWPSALFGLADPITSADDDRYAVMQLAPNANVVDAANPTRGLLPNEGIAVIEPKQLTSRGFSFERLPGTSAELRSVAAILSGGKGAVEVRVGAEATKQRLLDTDLSRFRFLHFATHGVLPTDTNIREPALVLSYDGISASHMFLTSSEILGMKLHSDSVVLSACNTGAGAVTRAEGVMSLGRAFLAAGASSVTVSLWQVADDSTARLMEEYYRGIMRGQKKSAALAEARYRLFSEGRNAPFFWAPFILIGE